MSSETELRLDEFEKECETQGLNLDELAKAMISAGKAAKILGEDELANRCLKFLTSISSDDDTDLMDMSDVLMLIQDCKKALLEYQRITHLH